MSQKQADDIRQSVRDSYAKVAEASDAGECCGVEPSCCGVSADINSVHSTRLGYPEYVRDDPHLHACCVTGAALVDELRVMLEQASFTEIRITPKDESREFISDWVPGSGVEDYVVSAHIEAIKPK